MREDCSGNPTAGSHFSWVPARNCSGMPDHKSGHAQMNEVKVKIYLILPTIKTYL